MHCISFAAGWQRTGHQTKTRSVVGEGSTSWQQVCLLDGNKYMSRCRETGEQSWEILRDCMVLRNQRGEPLLTSRACPNDTLTPQVEHCSQF